MKQFYQSTIGIVEANDWLTEKKYGNSSKIKRICLTMSRINTQFEIGEMIEQHTKSEVSTDSNLASINNDEYANQVALKRIVKNAEFINELQDLDSIIKDLIRPTTIINRLRLFYVSISCFNLLKSMLHSKTDYEKVLIENSSVDCILINSNDSKSKNNSCIIICNQNAVAYENLYFSSSILNFFLKNKVSVCLWNYKGFSSDWYSFPTISVSKVIKEY